MAGSIGHRHPRDSSAQATLTTSESAKISIDKPTKINGYAPANKKSSKACAADSFTFAVKVASLPFRFKAGGNMAPLTGQHHHRSTTKQPQKSFKSRHATKSALKERSKGMRPSLGV
jgi:hypothetical protein